MALQKEQVYGVYGIWQHKINCLARLQPHECHGPSVSKSRSFLVQDIYDKGQFLSHVKDNKKFKY